MSDNQRINVTQALLPPFQEYCGEIQTIWNSHWMTNAGEKHTLLTQRLREYLGHDGLVLLCNGHLGLEAALEAMNLTGEVITTPFTFVSTTHAIVRKGLVPVFCDVKPENGTLDPAGLEALITPRTSAILPVHVYGNLCDDEEISRIAKKHGLKVIYDAAHTFGVKPAHGSVMDMGDASILSFHATKVFNSIEGGAVACRDQVVAKRIQQIINFGIADEEQSVYPGGNGKLNEFQAAMGLCNLRHVEEEIARRCMAAQRYREGLSGTSGIRVLLDPDHPGRNSAYFPVVFDGYRYTRDEVADRLKQRNIYARKYFWPLTTDMPAFVNRFGVQSVPVARRLAEHILCLPMYGDLTREDTDRILAAILD